jgi:hypothetical protein
MNLMTLILHYKKKHVLINKETSGQRLTVMKRNAPVNFIEAVFGSLLRTDAIRNCSRDIWITALKIFKNSVKWGFDF